MHARLLPPVARRRPRPGVASIETLSDERERERLVLVAERERELRKLLAAQVPAPTRGKSAESELRSQMVSPMSVPADEKDPSKFSRKQLRLTSGGLIMEDAKLPETSEQPENVEQLKDERRTREPRPSSVALKEASFLTEVSISTE